MQNSSGKTYHLISTRGVRHKIGGANSNDSKTDHHHEESTTSRSSSSEEKELSSNEKETKPDPMKFEHEFRKALQKYIMDFSKKKDLNEFIAEFNDANAAHGYEIERKKLASSDICLLLSVILGVPIFLLYLLTLKPGSEAIIYRHKLIINQVPVSFDEFTRDYLSTGEVQGIFYYPIQAIAIAMLYPGAMIGRQQFTLPGVHIALDERFHSDPLLFIKAIRDTEDRIGINERDQVPIAVKTTTGSLLLFLIGWSMLLFFVVSNHRRWLANILFRVVPATKKGNNK